MTTLRRHFRLLLASAVAAASTVGFERAAWIAEHAYDSLLRASGLAIPLTPLALALVALVARRWFGVVGSGMPEIVAAHAVDREVVRRKWASLRDALARAGLTLAGLACGASVGRQGPSVALGAALVYATAERGDGDADTALSTTALEMGAAAGVTAAYNAPLAGIVFAIEQLRIRSMRQLMPTVAAAAVAWTVASAIRGTTAHFASLPVVALAPGALLAALAAAGFAAMGGVLFARAAVGLSALLSGWRARHLAACAIAGAGLLEVLAFLANDPLFGTGEPEIARMVKGEPVALFYPLAKALATLLSLWIGLSGGLFGPTIAVGAGIGSALTHVFAGAPAPLLVMCAMAAFLAAATRTPLTAGVFAVEASGQYMLAPVLLGAALLGHALSTSTERVTIYSTPARRLLASASPHGASRPGVD